MDQISRRILADNVARMIERSKSSVRAWAMGNGLDVRKIDRLTKKEYSTTLDTLDEIAAAIGVQPWQLLVPNMDLNNPPLLVMSEAERQIYERIRSLVKAAEGK